MSGGSPSVPTQTATPIQTEEQRQLMQLAMPGVEQFAANVPQRYQGPTQAGFDPSQTAGQESVLAASPRVGELARSGADASQFYTSGDIWNPASNPNLQGAVDASVRPLYQQLTETALPAIRQEAITYSGLGGSREDLAQSRAIRDTGVAAGDTARKLVQSQYETNVGAQLKALGLLPQTQQSLYAEGTGISGVGDVRQQELQRQYDLAQQNYMFDQYAPFLQSKEILSLIQGLPGGGVQTTGSVPSTQPGLTQALGGAATGTALGSAIMPGVGTAAGAGIGALLPFIFK